MKRCPQCFQTYSDDISFCLEDGTTLAYVPEMASAPTVVVAPPSAFQPPQSFQTPPSQPEAKQGSNSSFIILGIGLLGGT